MRRMQSFGYLLFSLSLFYFFFLWQFPYDQVKKAIIQGFEETLPLSLSIEKVRPSFPSHLLIENIRIRSDALLFQIPDVTIQPNLLGFFWGKTDFNLGDLGNPQHLRGEFQLEKNQGRMKIWLNNFEIETSSQKEFSLTMKLSGEATIQWVDEDLDKVNGQAWALLKRGEVRKVQNSQLPFFLALFDTIRAEIQLQEGFLRVKRLEVSGKDLRESVQGDFQFPLKAGFPDLTILFQPSGR